jgi:hypothetical protein
VVWRLDAARARAALLGTTLVWLALAVAYALHLPLVMDELQGAYSVHQLGEGLPYRDFRPYKTLLGYALQWPVLELWPGSWWAKVHAVRVEMAVVAAAFTYLAARRLLRLFAPTAVVLATLLLALMSTWLERAIALRVDMLTGLCGLFALLALLDGAAAADGGAAARRRAIARAGFLAGLSLLVSQKGAYYVLAAGAGAFALATSTWTPTFRRSPADALVALCRDGVAFALAAASPMAAYVLVFGAAAGFGPVLDAVFLANRSIALDNLYDVGIKYYWFQTFKRNPLFWSAALLGLAATVVQRRTPAAHPADRPLAAFGATLLLLALWHKQPWPYFFVMVVPLLWVAVARLWHGELVRDGRLGAVAVAIVAVLGVALPLTRLPKAFARDDGRQRAVLLALERTLPADGRYLAGVQLLPTRVHALADTLGWLDARRVAALRRGDVAGVVAALRADLPLLVVESYRTAGLPDPLRALIAAETAPYCGPLRHAVAKVGADGALVVPASGRWRVEVAADGGGLWLAEAPSAAVAAPSPPPSPPPSPSASSHADGAELALTAGRHALARPFAGRLRRVAEPGALDDLDCSEGELFGGVYDW